VFQLKIAINSVLFDVCFVNFQEIPIVKGSRIAESWRSPPVKPLLKVYFFNITNPITFQNPKLNVKPVLKEVGPYVYEYVR
jgi:scavenger receptor class B protein 1